MVPTVARVRSLQPRPLDDQECRPSGHQQSLRQQIADLVTAYHAEAFAPAPFVPGESPVPVSGKVFDDHELRLLVDASLDFWLTAGRFSNDFEKRFAKCLGVRHAMSATAARRRTCSPSARLTSERLGKRRLQPGDEVITVAAGFPTTVNAILQNQLVPVFLDVELGTYDVKLDHLAEAVGPRTKAVFIAHTLGNPFDLAAIQALCEEHGLWLLEDNCDALGARYDGQLTGNVRRHLDRELLPGPPHHDGRGRRRDGQASDAQEDRRELPRLGPRLLVRDR